MRRAYSSVYAISDSKMLHCLITIVFLLDLVDAIVPPNEIDALQALYDATNGDSWVETCRSGWNFTSSDVDPCRDEWYGITCTSSDCANSTCHITWLTLVDCNLDGSISYNVLILTFYRISSL